MSGFYALRTPRASRNACRELIIVLPKRLSWIYLRSFLLMNLLACKMSATFSSCFLQ